MSQLTTKFLLKDQVIIKEIDTHGIVRAIQFDITGVSFKVSYWLDGKLQEVWLFEDELEKQ